MKGFEIGELVAQGREAGKAYLEFLKVEALSAGVYMLPAGGVDKQQPHTEDEVYYIVSGAGTFYSGGEERPVKAGSVLYVAAEEEHRFHSITEDLVILVFFAPAEYSQAKPS
jgi:mannose-6-phosphate isomerase-like protein (cupin superfamily)